MGPRNRVDLARMVGYTLGTLNKNQKKFRTLTVALVHIQCILPVNPYKGRWVRQRQKSRQLGTKFMPNVGRGALAFGHK